MLYIRLVALTSRVVEHHREIADNLIRGNGNFIFAFWHSRQFFLGYARRNDHIKVLVSESADGEYIARVIRFFGMDTVRGSTSRGGARALVRLKGALRQGWLVGITPDGPRGPAGVAQQGVIALAQKSGLPIIPLSFGAARAKVFNSWDRYVVPYPFNRIAVTYGDPIHIMPGDNPREAALLVARRMRENTVLSDTLAGQL